MAVSPSEAGETIPFMGKVSVSDFKGEEVETITCSVSFHKGDTIDAFLRERIAPKLPLPLVFPENLEIRDSLYPQPLKISDFYLDDIAGTRTFTVSNDPRIRPVTNMIFYKATLIQVLEHIAYATGTKVEKTESAIKLVYPSSGPNENKEK